jgi:Arc-like DNA binding domain
MARRKTDMVQFKVRLREDLRKRLEIAAKNQDRSLNSEMVHRLEHSFAPAEEATTFLRNLLRGMLENLGPGELSDLAPPMPASEAGKGEVINLIDALRQKLGRAPTIDELHAARRRALQVEPSDEEPELPMAPRRKIGGES